MSRWDAFTAVCGHLRAGLLDAKANEQRPVPWELVIQASSHHYVTPALAWCLRDEDAVPADVRDYLSAILASNGTRNEALLDGLARIVAALNGVDIAPVLLKGAARLVEETYPAPTLRFLGDLDVLIPAERSADAIAALRGVGFDAADDAVLLSSTHHHIAILQQRETGFGVELHLDVLPFAAAAVIPTGWFLKKTRPVAFRGLDVRLPDATRSVGHIVGHDQMPHFGFQGRRALELRQLLDLAMIRKTQESAIDWDELEARFSSIGFGRSLATYLMFVEALLGQPAPRLKHSPLTLMLADFKHQIEPPPAWQWPATALIDEIARQRLNPHSIVHAFDPKTWPGHAARLARAFRRRRSAPW